MDNSKAKKIFVCVIAITILLALVIIALPMDSLVMGYSGKNETSGFTMKPKTEGLLISCCCPVLMFFLWIANNRYMGVLSEERKVKMKNSNLLYLCLSPVGAIVLIVNLVLYFA